MLLRLVGITLLAVDLCAGGLSAIPAFAQIRTVQPRITQAVDESQLVPLRGNVHPWARAEFDRGPAPPDLPMQRMLLVLKRSQEQEAALQQLLDQQQDKSSQNFHKWLTPEQFGQQFGPADEDIQTITAWLQSHGFQVARVSKGRTVVEFSGVAAQVQEAFHTAIHKFTVNGEDHWANASDPQIPAALTPVVGGVLSLHNFRARPLYHNLGVVSRSKATGKITSAQPLFTIPEGNGCGVQSSDCYGVGPYDFATIYNVLPLWTATPAVNGAGQTIAIIGETDINPQDVTAFRNFFGLPVANLQVIHDGPAPGILQGEETESDLDVEWSGAVAPGATIDFVVAESTETTQGINLSALHLIDNNLAPVMSESYGQCELFVGTAGNRFFAQLWQQAAAQGITVMIASGDQGSAVCDPSDMPAPTPAKTGLEVSGYSSTPYNVAVGGTDFADLTNAATYWNTTNNSTTQASAKSYIPESTWNDSCTNAVFGTQFGFSTNPETNCNNQSLVRFVETFGGSGGKSRCISSDGQNPSSCTGGYPKPSWQSSLTPNDGARDVPDVSLFAAVGLAGSFYLICEADQSGAACNLNDPTADFLQIGGTSASAPAFAGIMALVNQQTGSRQGNANYVLYKLAAQQPSAFHDITTGTIAMPCETGSPNCTTATAGDAYGVLSGYNAGTGYDLATGLGSVNVANLVTKWAAVTLTPSTTTLNSLTPTTITHGQAVDVSVSVAPQSGTGTPTGTVSLLSDLASDDAGIGSFALNAGGTASGTTNALPGGTYHVTAHYAGDGTFGSSDSAPMSVTVNKENSTAQAELVVENVSNGQVVGVSDSTTAVYGTPYLLRANIMGSTCSSNSTAQVGCPTGSVTVTDNGMPLDGGAFPLNSAGYAEDVNVQLSGGTHSVQVTYGGDNSFNPSVATVPIVITPASTTISTPDVFGAVVGSGVSASTIIQAYSSGTGMTGTVSFTANGTPLKGTVTYDSYFGPDRNGLVTLIASFTSDASAIPSTGTYTIVATYSGDSNYSGATSAGTIVKAMHPQPTVYTKASSYNLAAGQNLTLTTLVISGSTSVPPTGTVTFSDSQGQIPGNITYSTVTDADGYTDLQATITFAVTASDNYSAYYNGDANYPASFGGAVSITVTGNDFSLSFNGPSAIALTQGGYGQLNDLVVSMQSETAPVTFTATACSGLPVEATCVVAPASITYTSQIQINVNTTAPHSTTKPAVGLLALLWWQTSIASGLFGIVFLGKLKTNRRSGSVSVLITLLFIAGMAGCGGGNSFTSGGGGGGGNVDPGTLKGNYVITVTGTSGAITHNITFQLVVQ